MVVVGVGVVIVLVLVTRHVACMDPPTATAIEGAALSSIIVGASSLGV